jgi:hypothetical protein
MKLDEFHPPAGSNKCLCSRCGQVFGGVTGFDQHQVTAGKGVDGTRCLTPAEIAAKGYVLNAKQVWVHDWAGPAGSDAPHELSAKH